VTTLNAITVRELERASIRQYAENARIYLRGRVLDYGAGRPGTCRQPEPYRDCIYGEYISFDIGDDQPAGEFDAVLMTQVIQYVDDPTRTLLQIRSLLKSGGVLVMTGPTNWAEVEETDLWRFTQAGIRRLLERVGFSVVDVRQRAAVEIGGFVMSLGWGAVAVKV
jgi:SAM-dependent methyltransferase